MFRLTNIKVKIIFTFKELTLPWPSNLTGEFYPIRVASRICIEKNPEYPIKIILIQCMCIFCFVLKGTPHLWEKFLFLIHSPNSCISLRYGIVECVLIANQKPPKKPCCIDQSCTQVLQR